jgi:RNase P subunit RPR2
VRERVAEEIKRLERLAQAQVHEPDHGQNLGVVGRELQRLQVHLHRLVVALEARVHVQSVTKRQCCSNCYKKVMLDACANVHLPHHDEVAVVFLLRITTTASDWFTQKQKQRACSMFARLNDLSASAMSPSWK